MRVSLSLHRLGSVTDGSTGVRMVPDVAAESVPVVRPGVSPKNDADSESGSRGIRSIRGRLERSYAVMLLGGRMVVGRSKRVTGAESFI